MPLDTDELTPAEEALLRNDTSIPPAEDDDGTAPPPAPPAEGVATAAPAAPAAAVEGEPAAEPAATPDPDADFAAFVERHAGKTPEELLKLSFQQDKARRAHYADAKVARETIAGLTGKMTASLERTRAAQAAERAKFEETLASDPDAAARMALERTQRAELQAVETGEWDAYVGAQTELARTAIAGFDQAAPEMLRFGIERLGYDEAQVRAVHDARDLQTLAMAMRFDKLVQSGFVDPLGNLTAAGMEAISADAPPVDARLTMPAAPRTLSTAAGRSQGAKGLRAQAQDALAMAEKDFDQIPEAQLEAMLRGLGGPGQ